MKKNITQINRLGMMKKQDKKESNNDEKLMFGLEILLFRVSSYQILTSDSKSQLSSKGLSFHSIIFLHHPFEYTHSRPFHTTIRIFFSSLEINNSNQLFVFLSQIPTELNNSIPISRNSCHSRCGNKTVTT